MNRNGIDIEQLHGMTTAMRDEPQAGTVAVRTRHRWDDGFAVDNHAEELQQAGQTSTRTHTFRTDWPAPFSDDTGPTPGMESLLGALGACVATTYALQAALAGVAIDDLEVTVEGRLALQGLFGLDAAHARPSDIAITVAVRSDADDSSLDELGETTTRTSPAFDALTNPVPLQLSVQRLR